MPMLSIIECTSSSTCEDSVITSVNMCLLNARSVANKAHVLNDLFVSQNFLFLTENWQCNSEFIHLNELCSVDCSFIGSPRLSGRGGGLAIVWRNLSLSAGERGNFLLF